MRGRRQIGSDQGILHQYGAGSRKKDLLPDASVAIANGRNPVPANGGEKRRPVDGRLSSVLSQAIAQSVLVRDSRMGLRRNKNCHYGLRARLYMRRNIEHTADECAALRAHLFPVDPDAAE